MSQMTVEPVDKSRYRSTWARRSSVWHAWCRRVRESGLASWFVLLFALSGVMCFSGCGRATQMKSAVAPDTRYLSTTEEAAIVPPDTVCATFLANAGFLLTGSGEAVLIDAFVSEPYSMYGSLTPLFTQALSNGTAPFDDVDLALASHVHGDHFQAIPAVDFLTARTGARLLSTPQVVESLVNGLGAEDPTRERISVMWPEQGRERFSAGAIQVDFLPMRHTNERNYGVQNLAHLIRLGGTSFLHVGDAEMLVDHYDRFDLVAEEIDVGLVPYWFFMSESGRRIVYRHIVADRYVAMHVPPAEADETVDALMEIDGDIIVAAEPGTRWCF